MSNHEEAASCLPQLARTLIASLIPRDELMQLSFSAGKGIHAGGYDGTLVTSRPTVFASTGKSFWELSVNENCNSKADSDYANRKGDADTQVTYVALTGRRWAGKEAWAEQRRADGLWADVRVYDAVDLATWLGQTVSGTVWLASKLGNPVHGVTSGDIFLRNWRSRTDPPLCAEVLVAGRDKEVTRLREWLNGPPGVLRILAETRDETVAFVVAAAGVRSSDAVVPIEEAAWSDLIGSLADDRSDSVLIPAFPGYDGSAALGEKHHLIIPVEPGEYSEAGPDIRLQHVPRDELANALELSGLDSGHAHQVANMSGGKLSAVQRICGYVVSQPPWCSKVHARVLTGMLLAGAWKPSCEGDRRVLSALCAAPWEDIESATTTLLTCPDAPLRRHGDTVRLRSAKDAWVLLGRRLTDSVFEEYVRICTEHLAAPNPAYDLPVEERMYANLRGQVPPQSSALRLGLCNTLCWLSLHSGQITPVLVNRSPESMVKEVIIHLLSCDWRTWASLGTGLRSMAEADPDEFLDRVREAARGRRDELEPLFAQDSEPSIFGGCAHTDLLWAVETVAWNAQHFPAAAFLLCELCGLDHGGTYSNRPFASLASLFMPHTKMSTVTSADRNRVLQSLVRSDADTGWRLVRAVADMFAHGGCVTDNCRPRFLAWPLPPPFAHYQQEEIRQYLGVVRDLYVELLDASPSRLAEIVGIRDVRFIGLTLAAEKIREHKEALMAQPEPVRSLRKALREHYHFADNEESDTIDVVKHILEETEPADLAERHAWLFDMHPHLPGYGLDGWEEEQNEVVRLRTQAADDLITAGDIAEAARKIAQICDCPGTIGETLGQRDEWIEHVPFITEFERSTDGRQRRIAASFWSIVLRTRGLDAFLAHVASQLPLVGQEEAGKLVALVPSSAEIRDWLETQDTSLSEAYWREIPSLRFSSKSDEDFSRIIRNLLAVHRWGVAMDAAHDALHRKPIGHPDDLLLLLKHGQEASQKEVEEASRASMFSWTIEKLFEKLDAAGFPDTQEIANLEIYYLRILENSTRGPRTIIAELDRNPRFLVHVLTMAYRAEDEDSETSRKDDTAAAKRAETALYIQQAWTSYPGRGLPPDKRDTQLREWCKTAMALCREAKRQKLGDIKIGEVLSRVPSAETDGIWPCIVARELIETGTDELARGVMTGHVNARGVTSRAVDEGGVQERELAARCRSDADRLRLDYPVTARLLERLASGYDYDAKHYDVDAEEFTDPWL